MDEYCSGTTKIILAQLEEIKNNTCSPVEKLKNEVESLCKELLERGKYVENETSLNELQENLEAHLETLKYDFKEAELQIIQLNKTDNQWTIFNEFHIKTRNMNGITTNLRSRVRKLNAICLQKGHEKNQTLEKLSILNESVISMNANFREETKRVLDKHPDDDILRRKIIQLEQKLNERKSDMNYYYETIRQKIETSNDNYESIIRMFQTEKKKTCEVIKELEDELQKIVQNQPSAKASSESEPCRLQENMKVLYDETKQSLNDLKLKIDQSTANAENEDERQKLFELKRTVKDHIDEKLESAYILAEMRLKNVSEGDNNLKIEIFFTFRKNVDDINTEILQISTKIQNLRTDYEQCLLEKENKLMKLKELYENNILIAHKLKETIANIIADNDIGGFIDKEDMTNDLNEIRINLDNITENYLAIHNEERDKIDAINDVAKQYEIIVKFEYASNKMKTDIDALNSKFVAIKERYNISPEASLARAMRSQARNLGLKLEPINNLEIFKLPIQEMYKDPNAKLRRFELGETRIDKVHRYVMLTGMTGSGKSLHINNMINYIYGVSHNDKFRFMLIVKEEEIKECGKRASKCLAESMTSWVTSYTFNWQEGFRIDYSLTVIDTPGFGDTRGLKYDEMIVGQIRKFVNNEQICPTQELTSIGLLIQASQARITEEQKYIFDQILNILGKDMKNNIFIIFTFADAHDPPALEVVKKNEIPHAEGCIFKFNNSALYASNKDEKSFTAWKDGYDYLSSYFNKLLGLQHMSLKLTKEVLDEREHLRTALGALQHEIEQGMETLRLIDDQSRVIEHLEGAIKANKDYKVKKKTYDCTMQTVNHYITNCKQCNFTCHSPCQIAGDMKQSCAAMENGKCKVCEGKCPYDEHINGNQVYIYTPVEIEETIEEMMKDYNVNVDDKNAKKKLLSGMLEKYKNQREKVFECIKEANKCSNRLEEISLRCNFLSDVAFIERLIASEERSNHPYKTERLNHYRALKDMAKTLKDAKTNPHLLIPRVGDYEKRVYDFIRNIEDIGEEIQHLTLGDVTQLEDPPSEEASSCPSVISDPPTFSCLENPNSD